MLWYDLLQRVSLDNLLFLATTLLVPRNDIVMARYRLSAIIVSAADGVPGFLGEPSCQHSSQKPSV